MSLLEKLISEQKKRNKRRKIFLLVVIGIIVFFIFISRCERPQNLENSSPKKREKVITKADKKLKFGQIKRKKTTEKKLSLKSYKLLVISAVKKSIESQVDFKDCDIDSEITWKFRWYPKSGEIKNNEFLSLKKDFQPDLKLCLKRKVRNLRVNIKNKLNIAYVRLELKIK